MLGSPWSYLGNVWGVQPNVQNSKQRRGRRIGMFYYVFYEGAHAGMRKRRHAKKKFWTPCSAEGLRRACGGPADSLTAHRALRGPRGHAKKKARLSDFTQIECSVRMAVQSFVFANALNWVQRRGRRIGVFYKCFLKLRLRIAESIWRFPCRHVAHGSAII